MVKNIFIFIVFFVLISACYQCLRYHMYLPMLLLFLFMFIVSFLIRYINADKKDENNNESDIEFYINNRNKIKEYENIIKEDRKEESETYYK